MVKAQAPCEKTKGTHQDIGYSIELALYNSQIVPTAIASHHSDELSNHSKVKDTLWAHMDSHDQPQHSAPITQIGPLPQFRSSSIKIQTFKKATASKPRIRIRMLILCPLFTHIIKNGYCPELPLDMRFTPEMSKFKYSSHAISQSHTIWHTSCCAIS